MPVNSSAYQTINEALKTKNVALVAVSKLKPVDDIKELHELGQRDFGENYVQELLEKEQALPKDIQWHFIGHLQSNKVKYIAPFVHLVQSVDSERLLKEIDKQAKKNNRIINCLLQVHIAEEETKFGFDTMELASVFEQLGRYKNVQVKGIMGMASFSNDDVKIRKEFGKLNTIYNLYSQSATTGSQFSILSMGMSGDYKIAIEEGSNMVRIGSLLFGARK